MVTLKWTGWNKNKNVVSLSHLLQQLLSGKNTESTSSIHQDTQTSLLRLNVLFVYLMDQLLYLMHNQVLNLKQKLFGVKQLHMEFLVSYSLTKWIKQEQTSYTLQEQSMTDYKQTHTQSNFQSELKINSKVLLTLLK